MSQPPKRIVTVSEKSKVTVDELKIGMFVEELDRPWENTPFLMQGFHIKTAEDIETIQNNCEFVYISTERSLIVTYDNIGGPPVAPSTLFSKEVKSKTFDPELADSLQKGSTFRPTIPAQAEFERASTLTDQGRDVAKNFLNDALLGKSIDTLQVQESVSECMHSIMANPDAMLWLSKIRNEDEYTSQHSFNVCILALIFGRHLGFEGDALANLGICGMLHDVGKMKIPMDILNKEGMLTPDEFEIMKTHTTHGRDILKMNENNILPSAIEVAYGHHEAVNGKGYPRGIPSGAISDLCRIVQVCDVYDAVTSLRVYKKAETSSSALKILYDNRGIRFDKYFVEEFIACIGLYPPGSIVELTSDEVAIVVATNYDNRRLPKVAVVCDADKKLCQIQMVNLAKATKNEKAPHLLVKTALPNGAFGVRLEEYVKQGLKVG